jgi:hypothetical protein
MRGSDASHGGRRDGSVREMKNVWRSYVGAIVLILPTTGCDSGHDAAPAVPSGSPSRSVVSRHPTVRATGRQTLVNHPRVVRGVVATLQEFLDAWVEDGLASASSRYLVHGERVTSNRGVPRLASGSVKSYQVTRRTELDVMLQLHFDGDSEAWGQGVNERFITAHRVQRGRYVLAFATAP